MKFSKLILIISIAAVLLLDIVKSEVNLARGKNVSYSSNQDPSRFHFSRTVDGNTDQSPVDVCSHTAMSNASYAWWRVDLGDTYNVEKIKIYYRAEGTLYRFIGYQLYYSNTSTGNVPSGELCYSNEGKLAPHSIVEHDCDYLARYVTVYKRRQNNANDNMYGAILELCEVEVYGCPVGYYGSGDCNSQCSGCGQGACNSKTGVCKECNDGFYGDLCDKNCSSNCENEKCDISSGDCSGCISGYYGLKCNQNCPQNCSKKGCDIKTGNCIDCIDGFYGETCNKNCSLNCGTNSCNYSSGHCNGENCISEYYGPMCETKCQLNCKECDFITGNCTECHDGYFGHNCSSRCASTCSTKCDYESGKCIVSDSKSVPTSNASVIAGTVVGALVLVGLTVLILFGIRRGIFSSLINGTKSENSGVMYQNSKPVSNHSKNKADYEESDEDVCSSVEDQDQDTYQNLAEQNLSENCLDTWLRNLLRDPIKLKEEYEALTTGSCYPHAAANTTENQSKNRYKSSYPYDHSRVKLDVDNQGTSDYINANYIDGINAVNAYIATQGPKLNTVNDFWRMVWQHNTGKIVMLTNLIENGKVKCNQYWPEEGKSLTTDSFQLDLRLEKRYSFYTLRKIHITLRTDSSRREITQFHFTTWPDHGTPDCQEFLQFHRKFMYEQTTFSGPTIVHCSAGIGRTGTFIALDTLYLQGKATEHIDIRGFVETMRQKRVNMIQTPDQYICLHETLAEAFGTPDTITPKQSFFNTYISNTGAQTKLEDEFKLLQAMAPSSDPAEYTVSLLEENRYKNASSDVLAANRYRIHLTKEIDDSDYINAISVPTYAPGLGYMVTHFPLPNTIEQFWSMVNDYNVKTIVVLDEEESYQNHSWLPSDSRPLLLKSCSVRRNTEKSLSNGWSLVQEQVIITAKFSQVDTPVSIVRVSDLPHDVSSTPVNTFLMPINLIRSSANSEDHPAVVMCPDGAMFCGLFCLLSNTLQQIALDDEVDIFQVARRIQNRRPQFIKTLEQYEYCFKVASIILERSDVYENINPKLLNVRNE